MSCKILMAALCAAVVSTQGASAASFNEKICASYFEKQLVRNYYFGWGGKPADPMAIPSHTYRIVESKITSSFSDKKAIGVTATPKIFKEVWKSVDSWGEKTPIKIVITVDGWHAYAFPSHVPTTNKKEHAKGFYDIFADDGEGVRGHINPDLVSMIYAVKLPAGDGTFQRSVSFYSHGGDLIFGLYATEGGKPQNKDAIAGFDRTWDVISNMPRACKE